MRTGLPIIREFEGCKLKAYRCPAGVPTIGWGRTTNVKMCDACTQAQADLWLSAEYDHFAAKVHDLVNGRATDAQLGALVSFAYNIGVEALAKSTLLRRHNAGDFVAAANEFKRWNKASGRVLAGLTRRRLAEAALYAS